MCRLTRRVGSVSSPARPAPVSGPPAHDAIEETGHDREGTLSSAVSKRLTMTEIDIRPLQATAKIRRALGAILVEIVANGGSVGFMHPLGREAADAFWDGALRAADRGERIVLGAWDGEDLVGTLTLLLAMPPNQPHRAELAKMMVRLSHRGRGIASALVRAAENLAADRGRWLLVLDTATEEGASGLYERLGYIRAGEIPEFALKPHGGLTGTLFFWKRMDRSAHGNDASE